MFADSICSYFNLGMHHAPNTADLPNTMTTTAMSSVAIAPQNYFAGDIARRTVQAVRLSFDETSAITETKLFGAKQPTCRFDLKDAQPDLSTFVGELQIEKFPWNPSGSLQTNPGG